MWNLSILSRFYFYPFYAIGCNIVNILSILSRFYFYNISVQVSSSFIGTFNPIKVLFLPSKDRQDFHKDTSFNPIKVLFLHERNNVLLKHLHNFQSYQGSIFTRREHARYPKASLSFNPIKVLFLQEDQQETKQALFLSILSRFYFYKWNRNLGKGSRLLSILSRFYFYGKRVHIKMRMGGSYFQSYQGSIFTEVILLC